MLNRGFSGYQTEWALPVFEQVGITKSTGTINNRFAQIFAMQYEQSHVPQVELLTIWFGANDAVPPPNPQHVPRDEYMQNLEHMVDMVKSPSSPYYSPDTRIILITPPPVNPYQTSIRDFNMTKSYAEAAKEVGSALQIPVADVWTKIWEASGENEKALATYLTDGLHLTVAGYQVR